MSDELDVMSEFRFPEESETRSDFLESSDVVTGLREGLHLDDSELYRFHTHIQGILRDVDDVRAEVYGITTWRQDVKYWLTGLSRRISDTTGDVNKLRARLANTQSGTRKLLAAQGYPSKRALSPYAQELLREYSTALLLPYTTACAPFMPSVDFLTESPSTLSAVSLPMGLPNTGPATPIESAADLSKDLIGPPSPTPSLTSTSSSLSGDSEKHHTISDADLKALLYFALSTLRSRPSHDAEPGLPPVAQDAPRQGISQPAPSPGHRLPLRLAKRTSIKASLLYRPIVRRSLSAIGVASARPQPDPESLVSPGLGCGDQVLEG
ncbi:hypothetical protein C8Q70DRAFT_1121424 [Cubamyces menziesii]|nr:hypothetical protein C8Q70DRAFT_1121424 [Cubamyces menziesii]